MSVAFDHRHAGHCESGALSALLRHRGLDLSEPLVFGIGSGLFFIHLGFVKVGGIPLTAYRAAPRAIINNVCKRLGIVMRQQRFGDIAQGMRALDELLARNTPVGLQTSVFWLPYFPPDMRFQFNAHNLVAVAKEGEQYLLSDPVCEHLVHCPGDDLRRARFAKGTFAPKGLIYYPDTVPANPDINGAIRVALRQTAKRMVAVPMPFLGVRGIRTLARKIVRWPQKYGAARAGSFVGSVVRMQEEIGTGGAGFRFMYAAFLQEAAQRLNLPQLEAASQQLTVTGDRWREFAVQGARICKNPKVSDADYAGLADVLHDCAAREERIFGGILAAL